MKDIPRHIRKAIYARADIGGYPCCEYIVIVGWPREYKRCMSQVEPYGGIHHIIPKSRGGKDIESNLELRCVEHHMVEGHGQKVNMDAQLYWSGGPKPILGAVEC